MKISIGIFQGEGARKIAIASMLFIVCAWLGLELVPIDVSVNLPVKQIQADTGCGFTFQIPHAPGWPLTIFYSDSKRGRPLSGLQLFENGIETGPAHARDSDIRELGKGRYLHRNETLFFSASDCSNPIKNGYEYRAEIPVKPSFILRLIGVISLVIGIFVGWRGFSLHVQSWQKNGIGTLLYKSAIPSDRLASPTSYFIFSAVLVSVSLAYLFYLWSSGGSVSLSVAGFYQISDASGYWTCANSLLDSGALGNHLEWCQRRPIYSSWLAGIVAMGGRTIHGTLIVQLAIVSLALGLLIRQGVRLTGLVGGLLICALFLPYLHSNAWALTMTENAGLAFGLSGMAFLLRASAVHSARWMLVGCAFISIALNARAGAFFVLPMLILWAMLAARLMHQRVVLWGLYALAGCIAGFGLQFLFVWLVGGNPSHSHGNFSYTLYGLSVGGLGWTQVQADHPEVRHLSDVQAARLIYGWAFSNILSSPGLFVSGVAKGFASYLQLPGFGYVPLGMSKVATILWYLSWIPLWRQRHNPSYLLIGLGSLGVLLSAPILVFDGEARIFAATRVIDAIQVSIGLVWIILFVGSQLFQMPKLRRPLKAQSVLPEYLFIAIVALCFLVPYAYRVLLPRTTVVSDVACYAGDMTLVTRIGYQSLLLDLIESGQPNFMRGEVDRAALVRGLPGGAWYAKGVDSLTAKSILRGHQLDRSDITAPGPYQILSYQHLAPYFGKQVRICVSGLHAQELFGAEYKILKSIQIID